MLFGRNNKSFISNNLFGFVFTALIFCTCVTLVGCQTREQKIAEALQQCKAILDKDDIDQAYKCYLTVGKTYPENDPQIVKAADESLFEKCVDFKNRKNYEEAIKCLEGFIKLRPDSANVYFLIADSYHEVFKLENKETGSRNLKLLDDAEQAVKNGIAIDSNDASYFALYGEILKEKGNKQESFQAFTKATELNPKEIWIWIYFGLAQEKFGENEKALNSYQSALTLNPNNTLTLYYLEGLYEKTGNTNEAISTIEKRIQLESVSKETLNKLEELKNKQRKSQTPKAKGKAVGSGEGKGNGNKP